MEFNENLLKIQEGRRKNHGYSGVLDNNMPMNYITSDLKTELGEYLIGYVNPTLDKIITNILEIFSPRTINFLTSLPYPYHILNNCLYPSTAFNYLEPQIEKHRIKKAHKDNLDATPSVLFYLGDFNEKEGYLEFPEQQCKIFVKPGDLLFFKGNKYKHRVAPITTGTRLGLVYFAHKACKKLEFYDDYQKQSLEKHNQNQ